MTLLRGIADDRRADRLAAELHLPPTEVRFVDAEFVRIGTELACWEAIRGGTTTFVDMYYYPDSVAASRGVAAGCVRSVAIFRIDQKSPGRRGCSGSAAPWRGDFVSSVEGQGQPRHPDRRARTRSYTLRPRAAASSCVRWLSSACRSAFTSPNRRFEIDYSQKDLANDADQRAE